MTLYIIPVALGALNLGAVAGFSLGLVAAILVAPRLVLFHSPTLWWMAWLELTVTVAAGVLVGWLVERERRRRRWLGILNSITGFAARTPDLRESLAYALDRVIEELEVASTWIYLLDRDRGDLVLAAQRGATPLQARLALNEGPEGEVIRQGQLALLPEAGTPSPEQRALFLVPLRARDEKLGILTMSGLARYFRGDIREFLKAIADELAVAVERNALREQERKALYELTASEQKYRDLFEKASEAILILDGRGHITAANESAAHLTGYPVAELTGLEVDSLLPGDGSSFLERARQGPGSLEGDLVRRDGTRRAVQTSVAVVSTRQGNGTLQLIIRDITEQKQTQQNLEQYIAGITRAQEEERKRIARELHDDTAQSLVTISREMDNLASQPRLTRTIRHQIEEVRRLTDQTLQDVRRFSQDLRPSVLDDLGLLPAVQWLAERLERFGITPRTQVRGHPRRLASEAELALFRIIQEALNNVIKHAQATEVTLEVSFGPETVSITVKDNGQGFEISTASQAPFRGQLGLLGMRERVQLLKGSLELSSAPGKGTAIRVEVPA